MIITARRSTTSASRPAIFPPSTVVTSAVVFVPAPGPEGLGDIVRIHFAAEKIAAHVFRLVTPRAFERAAIIASVRKPRADAVGIDGVGADTVCAVVERVLAHQE